MSRPPLNDINTQPGLIELGGIPPLAPVAVFNFDGIENLLETKGFQVLHYQHALIPDRQTLNGPVDPNTQGASLRGVMYYSVREMRSVPQSFKLEDKLTVQGLYGVGTVLLNVTGSYMDFGKDRAHVSKRDLLVFPTVTDKTRQLLEWNPTGPMKLHYKIKGIDLLFDTDAYYQEGSDYQIINGEICWMTTGRKPRFDNGQPSILSCVYWYTPIYIVHDLPHSLRIIPSNPEGNANFPREATYAPQLVIAKPSTLMEEDSIIDWTSLPPYNGYPASKNTTGGSR